MSETTTGNTSVRVLAHMLFVLEIVGVALMVVLVAPHDRPLATYRSPLLLFSALTVVVGWLLAWKRPRIPIGWLLLGVGFLGALEGPAVAIGLATQRTDPSIAGWASEFGPESPWNWFPLTFIFLTLVTLRFPTGALPSAGWRWFWRFCVGLIIVGTLVYSTTDGPIVEFGVRSPTFVNWGPAFDPLNDVLDIGLVVMMVGSVASLFVRYRRGGSVERAQLRWLFWALAIIVGLLLVTGIENFLFGNETAPSVRGLAAEIVEFISFLSYSLAPLAILVAVLRSGLYSIDRIISRTASYAVVSLSVVIVYAGVVLVVSLLLPDGQSVGVALATLAAAAVCLPLLRVVRRGVDRRFNRAQYDADKVVDAFGERIRTGVDPHTAGVDLVDAVRQTLQPSALGLWLREDAR